MKLVLSTFVAAWVAAAAVFAQVPGPTDYLIGSQDIVTVTVYDHTDLTGKYTVESDGSFAFPLIGRVKAGGLTLRQLEDTLKTSLSDGYLKNPQVSVSMDEYKSQRVFVMGEVRAPGAYQLTGNMTVIEALAKAGGTTATAAEEVLIVRPHAAARGAGPAAGPTLATDGEVSVLKTNFRELQSGALSQNLTLKDGDTIVVNKAQSVYVFGQVRAPGAYPIERGTTVLQALSLAGGVTDRGSTGRIKIVRTMDGAKKELKVKLTDTVEPGDTLIVAERYF